MTTEPKKLSSLCCSALAADSLEHISTDTEAVRRKIKQNIEYMHPIFQLQKEYVNQIASKVKPDPDNLQALSEIVIQLLKVEKEMCLTGCHPGIIPNLNLRALPWDTRVSFYNMLLGKVSDIRLLRTVALPHINWKQAVDKAMIDGTLQNLRLIWAYGGSVNFGCGDFNSFLQSLVSYGQLKELALSLPYTTPVGGVRTISLLSSLTTLEISIHTRLTPTIPDLAQALCRNTLPLLKRFSCRVKTLLEICHLHTCHADAVCLKRLRFKILYDYPDLEVEELSDNFLSILGVESNLTDIVASWESRTWSAEDDRYTWCSLSGEMKCLGNIRLRLPLVRLLMTNEWEVSHLSVYRTDYYTHDTYTDETIDELCYLLSHFTKLESMQLDDMMVGDDQIAQLLSVRSVEKMAVYRCPTAGDLQVLRERFPDTKFIQLLTVMGGE